MISHWLHILQAKYARSIFSQWKNEKRRCLKFGVPMFGENQEPFRWLTFALLISLASIEIFVISGLTLIYIQLGDLFHIRIMCPSHLFVNYHSSQRMSNACPILHTVKKVWTVTVISKKLHIMNILIRMNWVIWSGTWIFQWIVWITYLQTKRNNYASVWIENYSLSK